MDTRRSSSATVYGCPVSITVRDLLDVPHLRMSVLAGDSGLDRPLSWAHVCELPDPSAWLNGGELVLSVGMALSREPAEQVAYLRRLDAADAGAVCFGDTQYFPQLTPEAKAAADELGLPVLWVEYEVPYIAIARVVVDSAQRQEQLRLKRLQRAYEAVRRSAQGEGDPLVQELERLAGCRLHVLELPYGNAVLGTPELEGGLRAAVLREVDSRDVLPAVLRADAAGAQSVVVPVPASRVAALVAVTGGPRPDVPLLQHFATILAVELERTMSERERERRLGAELFAKLLDQTIEGDAAERRLAERGLGNEPRTIVAWSATASPDLDASLHHRLAARGVDHLLLRRDVNFALVSGGVETLADELSASGAVGLSAPLGRASRSPDAAREARLALRAGLAEGRERSVYGEQSGGSPFLPYSISDATAVVERVLGPLITYDRERASDLVASLRAFLEHNRSWQRTAEKLHIHKQTLHYRMRRVEEITGRRLDTTADVSVLWLAFEALSLLDGEPLGAGAEP